MLDVIYNLWVIIAPLIGVFLGYILNVYSNNRNRKSKLKAHWSAIEEEATICKERAEEFLAGKITSPLYRLPVLYYSTSVPVLLAEGDITGDNAKSLIKFFTQVQHFNRGLDISEKLFINGKNLDKIHDRNKLYAEKLVPGNSEELFTDVFNIFEKRKIK